MPSSFSSEGDNIAGEGAPVGGGPASASDGIEENDGPVTCFGVGDGEEGVDSCASAVKCCVNPVFLQEHLHDLLFVLHRGFV